MKPETKALLKIEKVIQSCETQAHITSTLKLINNYGKLFKPKGYSLNEEYYESLLLLNKILLKKELETRSI